MKTVILFTAVSVAVLLSGCTGGNQAMGQQTDAAPDTGVRISGQARVGVVK